MPALVNIAGLDKFVALHCSYLGDMPMRWKYEQASKKNVSLEERRKTDGKTITTLIRGALTLASAHLTAKKRAQPKWGGVRRIGDTIWNLKLAEKSSIQILHYMSEINRSSAVTVYQRRIPGGYCVKNSNQMARWTKFIDATLPDDSLFAESG